MAYFPTPTGVIDFVGLFIHANVLTNNLFGLIILMIIFAISFITMINFGQERSFSAAMWLTTLSSVFLWTLQLVSSEIMIGLTLITALGSVFLFRTREN